MDRRGPDPGTCRDVGETTAAVVAVEDVGGPLHAEGTAIGLDAADVVAVDAGIVAQVEAEVVGDVEIEISVVVVVEEGGPGAVVVAGHPGVRGEVGEGAVAAVVVQEVGAVVGHVEVAVAVVVDISDRAPGPPPGVADPGGRGHVGEGAVAVVAVEGVPRPGALLEGLEGGPVDEVEVEVAVVVAVEESGAAAVRLQDVALLHASEDVEGGDAGGFRLIAETDLRRGLRGESQEGQQVRARQDQPHGSPPARRPRAAGPGIAPETPGHPAA